MNNILRLYRIHRHNRISIMRIIFCYSNRCSTTIFILPYAIGFFFSLLNEDLSLEALTVIIFGAFLQYLSLFASLPAELQMSDVLLLLLQTHIYTNTKAVDKQNVKYIYWSNRAIYIKLLRWVFPMINLHLIERTIIRSHKAK